MNRPQSSEDRMNNEIQVFNFNGADVRIRRDENGEPWFVAKDVCEFFGETNYRRAIAGLDNDEKGVSQINTHGGMQMMTTVNESGLYCLLFAMQPQKARGVSEEYIRERQGKLREFKRWVTGEVLPAIRRTGGYMAARPDEKPEEIMARALLLAKDTMDRQAARIAEQETRIAEQSRQIAEKTEALAVAAPKAAFVDNFCVSTGTILVRDFAKHIAQALGLKGFGEKVLFAYLKENGYLNINRYPTQYATDLGLFRVYEGIHQHNDGSTGLHHCSRITPKGQTYLYGKLKSQYDTRVRAIRYVGKEEIVVMETDTHTFIANGYAMHNCNRFSADHLIAYQANLIRKIGQGRFDLLAVRAKSTKKWSDFELKLMIKHYHDLVVRLSIEKGIKVKI